MKKIAFFLIILAVSINAGAQLISHFTWENNPVTTAAAGPNAISASSYATVTTGTNGTKGLNPGGNDINLVLDGSYFNVPALDISVDFRREESQASFFYRGNYFNFGMNSGSLGVNFQVASGLSSVTINSGNIYAIPDDHSFHNYHFNYDNNTGIAKVWVDAVLVYTYNGTAGTVLYWTGAGNVTIGKDMDATSRNLAILDNLTIQKYANTLLPLTLLSFTAEAKNKYAVINWNTTAEINAYSFILERSYNGINFSAVKTIIASNGFNSMNHYQFTDSLPFSPVSYYRLKMLNDNGSFTYTETRSAAFGAVTASGISLFPNPAVDYAIIRMNNTVAGKYLYTVTSITGQVITAASVQLNNGSQQIKIDLTKTAAKGVMIVKLDNVQANTSETFTLIKK